MHFLKKLVLKPTTKCFHNCLYCKDRQIFYQNCINDENQAVNNNLKGMQLSVLLQVGREAYELGMRECLISGGDPLIYPHLIKLISGIKKISTDIFVFMNSVGHGLTIQKATEILNAGLGAWNFSVDTINEKNYDYIRGSKGALKQTLKAFDIR